MRCAIPRTKEQCCQNGTGVRRWYPKQTDTLDVEGLAGGSTDPYPTAVTTGTFSTKRSFPIFLGSTKVIQDVIHMNTTYLYSSMIHPEPPANTKNTPLISSTLVSRLCRLLSSGLLFEFWTIRQTVTQTATDGTSPESTSLDRTRVING